MPDLLDQLQQLTPEQQAEFVQLLTADELAVLNAAPELNLRPDQLAVVRSQVTEQLVLCGRGWGKSHAVAYRLADRALTVPLEYVLIAPRFSDAELIEIEGPSGLLQALPAGSYHQNKSKHYVELWNGSRIHYRGSDIRIGGFRGLNLHGAVIAEAAAIPAGRYEEMLNEHVLPALRIEGPNGEDPWLSIVCTPKPLKWLRDLVKNPGAYEVVRGRTEDNFMLSKKAVERMRASLTVRQARQELDAEILDDIEGALWTWALIDSVRHLHEKDAPLPAFQQIVVGVDPAATKTGDEHGIIVAAKERGHEARSWILDDRSSGGLTPDQWGRRAVQAALDWQADRLIIETNQGGDMAVDVLQNAITAMAREGQPTRQLRVERVHASRGKVARAEPIVALYEQDRVRHLDRGDGALDKLHEQQTTWTPEDGTSPDRTDALVWALSHLNPTQPRRTGTQW